MMDTSFQHLAHHLVRAGREQDLRNLLLDFDWLQSKLDATEPNALIADYEYLPDDPDPRLVQDAIRLSAHHLAGDKTQLAGQVLGSRPAFRPCSSGQANGSGRRGCVHCRAA
jgi:hypothetical protein